MQAQETVRLRPERPAAWLSARLRTERWLAQQRLSAALAARSEGGVEIHEAKADLAWIDRLLRLGVPDWDQIDRMSAKYLDHRRKVRREWEKRTG